MTTLLTLAWMVGVTYAAIPPFWLLIHPFAERWRRAKVDATAILAGAWLGVILLLAIPTYPWRSARLYTTPYAWLAAFAFGGFAIATYRRVGSFGFGRLIGRTELEPRLEQRLITTGMHASVRHPIYLAHLCMLTAWAVGSGSVVIWGLWAFALLTGFFMIRAEDAELERRFGDEFREYKAKVPAIFPLR